MDLWVYDLRPGDKGIWQRDLTGEEAQAYEAHVAYIGQLLAAGRLILGGSTRDGLTGMIFFTAPSEEDARSVMKADPFITAKVCRGRLRPYIAGFIRGGAAYDFRVDGSE
jgi:uncharacterized protein YciI